MYKFLFKGVYTNHGVGFPLGPSWQGYPSPWVNPHPYRKHYTNLGAGFPCVFPQDVFWGIQRCCPALGIPAPRYKCYTGIQGCSLLSRLSLFPQVWKIHGTFIGSVYYFVGPPFEIGSHFRFYHKREPFAIKVVNAAQLILWRNPSSNRPMSGR